MLNGKRLRSKFIILSAVCAFTLAGCGKSADPEENPGEYIELGQYKGLETEKQVHEVTQDEIDDELATLAGAYGETETIEEGVVQEGDSANIDYVGTLNGEAFDGGSAEDYNLKIGSGTFIPGFEEGLIGKKIKDTVKLELTFPEDYGASELAGQKTEFTVTINYVVRTVLPEVTDDFIKEVSEGQYQDLDSYTEALEDQIVSEYDEYNELQYYADLLQEAVDNATVIKDIPSDYINGKVSKMVLNSQKMAQSYNLSFSDFLSQYMGLTEDEFYSQAADYANTAAKQSLVIELIAKTEGIEVSDEELDDAIDEYVELGNYESREDFLNQNSMDDLKEYILTSKVEDFLAANAAAD